MNIYVGNLPYSTTADDLAALFADYGEVTKASIIQDRETKQSKGFGFIEMAERTAGEDAIKGLNAKELGNRPLRINEARPREDRRTRSAW